MYCGKKNETIPGQLYKSPGAVKDFFSQLSGNIIFLDNVHTMLMHTRLNTNGHPEVNENNHPFNTKDFILAHNGNIGNWEALKTKHSIETAIECDSYIIVSLIQKFFDECKSIPEAIEKTVGELTGGFACWLYYKPKGEVYLFRNSNPIYYYIDKANQAFTFASEEGMIIKAYADTSIKEQIVSLPAYTIFKLNKDVLEEKGNLPYEKQSTPYYNNCNGRNWDGYQRNQLPMPIATDITNINKAFESLYLECEEFETDTNTVEFVIAIIQDGLRVLVRPDALINRLDEAGFSDYKKIPKDKPSDYCHYVINPPEKLVKLMDTYDIMNHPVNDSGKKKKIITPTDINAELKNALEDLANTLECELTITAEFINYVFASAPSELTLGLFKKVGMQPNKYHMIRIERTPSHLDQMKLLLKEAHLYEGA